MSTWRKIRLALLALFGVFAIWLLFSFEGLRAQARLGASYAAHISCSCRYIEGRPLDACYKDFEPGMELISVTDDPKNKRVTASVPLLASAVAARREGYGCLQLNDKEIEELN